MPIAPCAENQEETTLSVNLAPQSVLEAIPDYMALRAFATAQERDRTKNYTQDEEIEQIFAQGLDPYDVVSFDIFDTLLVRCVDHPSNVFFFLKDEPAFQKYSFTAPIHDLRMQAEQLARYALLKSKGSSEVNLSEIYAVFCQQNHLGLEEIPQLVAAEEKVELMLCRPNPFFERFYRQAKEKGKRVIAVSDMYLGHDFLLRLLAAKGFPVSAQDLYLSSRLRCSKQSGELFTKVLQDLAVPPKKILHVGDHPISDYAKPLEMGLHALLHQHKASSDIAHGVYSGQTATTQTHLRGMIRVARHTGSVHADFWQWLGYRVFGPLTVGFCSWLREQFRIDDIERAYFLLRDGELPYRVWQTLYEGDESRTWTALLPSSRRAMVFPLLENMPQFTLPNLICCIKPIPVREYLERLKIDTREFEMEFLASGFQSRDQMVDGRIEGKKLFTLFQQPRIFKAMLSRSRQEHRLIDRFFLQEGLVSDKPMAVIDLGWNGTIQKAMHLLLAQQGHPLRLKGYYLATWSGFRNNEVPGMNHAGYLTQRGEPAQIDQVIRSCYVLLEIIYSSLSGSLTCFRQGPNTVEGLFQDSDKSEKQSEILAKIHHGALQYAREFKQEPCGQDAIPPLVAAEELFRLIMHPNSKEAELIGALTHSENFSCNSLRYVAKFSSQARPEDLLHDFEQAYWKAGLLGQNSAQAMALRNLLWLMEAERGQ